MANSFATSRWKNPYRLHKYLAASISMEPESTHTGSDAYRSPRVRYIRCAGNRGNRKHNASTYEDARDGRRAIKPTRRSGGRLALFPCSPGRSLWTQTGVEGRPQKLEI